MLTPEEWVRRHVLAFLVEAMKVPMAAISQEHPVDVSGVTQRADIVVFDGAGQVAMVVECKAPEVAITQATLAQAFRYNVVLGAHYVMLTNGLAHYIYEVSEGTYTPLKQLSSFGKEGWHEVTGW